MNDFKNIPLELYKNNKLYIDNNEFVFFNEEEKKHTEFVIEEFEKRGHRILRFKNNFTPKDLENSEFLFGNILG